MVNLVVISKVKEEHLEFVKEEFKKLVVETRKEEGCIRYDIFNKVGEDNTFIFIEEWTTQELLDKHLSSPHIMEYKENTTDMFISKDFNSIVQYL